METYRIKINIKTNNSRIPINNQSIINGVIHKWLGDNNEYHDAFSNYNVSTLLGGVQTANKAEIHFPTGSAFLIISTMDLKLFPTLIRGIQSDPLIKWGLSVNNIERIDDKLYDGTRRYFALSPILLKRKLTNGSYNFVKFTDVDANLTLQQNTELNLKKINPEIDLTGFKIEFDNSRNMGKTKTIMFDHIKNECNQLPVIITGSKEIHTILYNIGIGQSRGCGFGCISPYWDKYYK